MCKRNKRNILCAAVMSLLVAACLAVLLPRAVTAEASQEAGAESTTYVFEQRTDSDWIGENVRIPTKFNVAGANCSDLTGVKAMVYEIDNSGFPQFTYNIGLYDTDHPYTSANTNKNEWFMGGTGSALYVPEHGIAYWAQPSIIPADFKGTVVLPLSTVTRQGTNWATAWFYYHQNPVFTTRCSQSAKSLINKYADDSVATFPTAKMTNSMTFYIHKNWNTQHTTLTFKDIRFVADYSEYLARAEAFDVESIGAASNRTTLDGAIALRTDTETQFKLNIRTGVSSMDGLSNNPALAGSVGVALRVANLSAATVQIETRLNENFSEPFYLLSGAANKSLPFVHADGRIDTVRGGGDGVGGRAGMIYLPAGYDGTVIIPFTALAMGPEVPNIGAFGFNAMNGRPDNNINCMFFKVFGNTEQTVAIAEVSWLYASYDAAVGKDVFTLKPTAITRNSDGTAVMSPKTSASWTVVTSGTTATTTVLQPSLLTLNETQDGEPLTENVAVLPRAIYYNQSLTLTLPSVSGRVIAAVQVDGQDVTDALFDGENIKTYVLRHTTNDGTPISIEVAYVTAFNVHYVLDGGMQDEKNPVSYGKSNTGDDALTLYPAVKGNYRFLGWFSRVEFSHPDAVRFESIDYEVLGSYGYNVNDLTLYAAYTNEYTVTVVDGSATAPIVLEMGDGLTENALAEFSKAGHTAHFYLDADCTVPVEFPYYADTADSNVYVQYESVPVTVGYQSLGGSAVALENLHYGDTATKPIDPVREGYRFDGWFTDDEYYKAFDFTAPVTEDTVIYAKWTRIVSDAPTVVTDTAKRNTLQAFLIVNSIIAGLSVAAVAVLVVLRLRGKKHKAA